MTHRPILEHWIVLLKPLFPPHAEFDLKPRLGQLRVKWARANAVTIFLSARSLHDYRSASIAARMQSDGNLLEFIRENLRQFTPDTRKAFRIVVASVDFVPLSPLPEEWAGETRYAGSL